MAEETCEPEANWSLLSLLKLVGLRLRQEAFLRLVTGVKGSYTEE